MSANEIEIRGNTFVLLPQKAIFWKEEKTLIIADAHLGKSTHFRKAGFAIPFESALENYYILDEIIGTYNPEKILFLGDLFHSEINLEWDLFSAWKYKFQEIEFVLIMGNHDILGKDPYKKAGFKSIVDHYRSRGLIFTHAPFNKHLLPEYVIAGHIHPRIIMRGYGSQRIKLSAFIFGESQALLPSFGSFTGGKLVFPQKEDHVFVILDGKVINVNTNR
jgi:DNA ligase-associated metallophosphoesterase